MKRISQSLLIVLSIFLIVMCKKNSTTSAAGEKTKGGGKVPQETTWYAKSNWTIFYKDDKDVGKKFDELKTEGKKWGEDYGYLVFGNKVTVVEELTIGDGVWFRYKTPSGKEYLAAKNSVATKYIVINKTDVPTYTEPDTSYGTKIKLQPGDLGFLLEEKDGWYKVEFNAYTHDDKRVWVGTHWIKDGFTDDIAVAKEAYGLYLSYWWEISKKNVEEALKNLNDTLETVKGNPSDITNVLDDYKTELEGKLSGE